MVSIANGIARALSTANLGTLDSMARIVGGLLLTGFTIDGPASWWTLLGLAAIASGAMWVCPVYWLLGVSTVSHEEAHDTRATSVPAAWRAARSDERKHGP